VPDIHLQDLPLPEDPWHGWIPDPPEDWLIDHDEEQQWFAEASSEWAEHACHGDSEGPNWAA
jgi:hypothetical protein